MRNPICFALDFPSVDEAEHFVHEHGIHEVVGAVKVGLELFISSSGAGLNPVKLFSNAYRTPVVLDLKLHDIPETVERAVKVGGDMGAKFMTLHAQQRATLERAAAAAEPFGMKLLAVTVLTSVSPGDLIDLRWDSFMHPPSDQCVHDRVYDMANFARDCGIHGVVCSPQEVVVIGLNVKPRPFMLVPGIRPVGSNPNDQKRVGTPGQAVKDGADLLVIGRPIRDAKGPRGVITQILDEISNVQSEVRSSTT